MSDMRSTIKKHSDFQFADNAPIVKTPLFLAKSRPTIFPGDARYGLITTKRTFKLAVHRNRARRLLRAWIRENEDLMSPDMDYVFIARSAILDSDKSTGIATMKRAIKSLK